MANANTNNASSSQAEFFDLHTTGIGYLSRIRRVEPSKRAKDQYFACTINALRGSKEEALYTKFDVIISGADAEARVLALKGFVDAKRKVMIQFKLGDIFPEHFTQTKGKDTGKVVCVIRGRLLQVKMAKVDNAVYNFVDVPSEQDNSAADGFDDAPADTGFKKQENAGANGFDDDTPMGSGFEAEFPPLDMAV